MSQLSHRSLARRYRSARSGSGYTLLFVGVVDMSAQAGLFGGGGLGDFAVTYGSQRYNWPVVYITVATIIIVQAGQFAGNVLARKALRR